MPKRKSSSKRDERRNASSGRRMQASRIRRTAKRTGHNSADPAPFEDFGSERTVLMKAGAVLHCLSASLSCSSSRWDEEATHAMAADVARDLVEESMERL